MFFNKISRLILLEIREIRKEIQIIMANQTDLDTSLGQLTADIATLVTAVTANSAAIDALRAAIAAGQPDLSTEVASVTAADQAVKDAVAAIGATDAPPVTPAA